MFRAIASRRDAIALFVWLLAATSIAIGQDPEILPGMPGESLPAGEPPTRVSPFSEGIGPFDEATGEWSLGAIDDAAKAPKFGVSGDWWGARRDLYDNGISFKTNVTQFYQGVAAGGLQEGFEYGLKLDYFGILDGEKLFGWSGFYINLHGETRVGESVNGQAGAILAPDFALQFPHATGTATALTNMQVLQFLSDDFVVYGGKINTPDGVNIHPFMGGYGTDRFQNMGFVINPLWGRILPYSTPGAGFTYLRDLDPVFTMLVVDPTGKPSTSGLDELFANGVTVWSQLRIPVELFGKGGHQTFEGGYATGRYSLLTSDDYVIYPPGAIVGPQTGSWAVCYGFDQLLVVDADNPGRGWGVFANISLSDGNPNPIHWFLNAGIAGVSPLPGRSADSFGLVYYYLGASPDLKDAETILFALRNEQGGEVYYDWAVTPWFRLTADVQGIDPGLLISEQALLFGVRGKLIF